MKVVLGIDAAWTIKNPSGVALAICKSEKWNLVAVAASYQRFHSLALGGSPDGLRPQGSIPDPSSILLSASILAGSQVDLVAVDMPLAISPITKYRNSDRSLSKYYGAKNCSTHTPSVSRPGKLSDNLRDGFAKAGYPLLTKSIVGRGIIEVYPHPALVELANSSNRLPYKIARIRDYWPNLSPLDRKSLLLEQWNKIALLLEDQVRGATAMLPSVSANSSNSDLKSYEDILDAIICAWVAICALEGRATSFGDDDSSIWVLRIKTA